MFILNIQIFNVNPLMANGGGGGGGGRVDAGFFLRMGRVFCKLNFQLYTDLALKLDKGRILGGGKHSLPHTMDLFY